MEKRALLPTDAVGAKAATFCTVARVAKAAARNFMVGLLFGEVVFVDTTTILQVCHVLVRQVLST